MGYVKVTIYFTYVLGGILFFSIVGLWVIMLWDIGSYQDGTGWFNPNCVSQFHYMERFSSFFHFALGRQSSVDYFWVDLLVVCAQ